MSIFTKLARDIFAPVNSAGVVRKVDNEEAAVWGTEIERVVDTALTSGSSIIFTSKADIDADLNWPEITLAWVIGDATAANNGIYQKVGASGTGSWSRKADLPYSLITLTDTGAGTANAVQATSVIPTSDSVLRLVKVLKANTGNVTISENGGTPVSLKTMSGAEVPAGGLSTGSMIAYVYNGADFRLLTDIASAAIQAAAEAAADRAEAAASGIEGASVYSTKALAEAITPATAPDFIRTAGYASAGDGGGALYYKNGTTTGDIVITLSDGTTDSGYTVARDGIDVRVLGIVANGSTDQTTALVAIISALDTAGFRGGIRIPFNVKFALKTVYAAVDAAVGLVLYDGSSINWVYSETYKVKMFRVTYTGDLENDDMGQMWASGHHPALFLNNFGTAGTTSGDRRYATILYGAGYKYGVYLTGIYQQAGSDDLSQWRFGTYLNTQFDVATRSEYWAAAQTVAVGDIRVAPASGQIYKYTVGGVTGSTEPTHTSGTATDGTATAEFYQAGVETGGQGIHVIKQDGSITRQNCVVGSHAMSDSVSIHPAISGGAGFIYNQVYDETSKSVSMVLPALGFLNLGKSTLATTTTAGCSIHNAGSGGSTNMSLFNGASGGGPLTIGNTVDAAFAVINIYAGGASKGQLYYDGSTVALTTPSDYRLKGGVRDVGADEAMNRIRAFRPHRLHYLSQPEIEVTSYLAHEVQAVRPDAVHGEKDAVNEDGTIAEQQMDYAKIIPDLHAALLAALDRIDALEAQLAA